MDVSVSLTPELVDLIKAKVGSDRYTATSEAVRGALPLLERADQREAEELGRLRGAWAEGVASGDAGPLDFEALKAEARGRILRTEASIGRHAL